MGIGGLMSIKSNFIVVWEALGNTKKQRFYRAFLVLLLIALVTTYGFHSDAINIVLGFGK